jgi:carbonic anhydrase/acetyltransferase-like protein (isoleucine patch superfamily)
VHPGASIATGAVVRGSIVGPGARIGERASVTDCVLGAGSSVAGGLAIDGVKVPTDGEAVPS